MAQISLRAYHIFRRLSSYQKSLLLIPLIALFALVGYRAFAANANAFVAFGDLNGDGIVNSADLTILENDWLTNNSAADVNGDGTVNIFDLAIMLGNWNQTDGTTSTLGNTSQGSSWTTGLIADDKFVEQFTMPQSGNITKLTYYVRGDIASSQVAKAIVYADNNGAPGALLGQGNQVTIAGDQSAGWVDFSFSSPISVSQGPLWIGLIRGATGGNIDIATNTTGGNEAYAANTYTSGASDPFGPEGGTSTYAISGYATYVSNSTAPQVSLSANPTQVASGGSSLLTWTSKNATACTGSGGWSGSQALSGSTSTGSLSATTSYSLTCTGPGGSIMASTTVTVQASGDVPPYLSSSAMNTAIPTNVAISPDTSSMIQGDPNWLLPSSSPYKQWLGPRVRTIYYQDQTSNFSDLPTVPMYVNFGASGYSCATTPINVPWPAGFSTEYSESGRGVSYDSITYEDDTSGDVWQGYRVTAPGTASADTTCASNRWNAVRMDYLPTAELTTVGYNLSGGDCASASCIMLGAGLLTPQDFSDTSQGSVIPHALRINAQFDPTSSSPHPEYVCPASAPVSGGTFSNAEAIPGGARIQLNPSIDVYTWPSVQAIADPYRSALEKILRTLQVYGAVYVDGSGGQGAGGLDTAQIGDDSSDTYPWIVGGEGWGYSDGIPYDLMSQFQVVDWNSWTGC